MNHVINNCLNKDDLIKIFKKLGISQGMTLEVHSSLKSLGYIIGGAETFIDALIETVGYNGTIVMPFQVSNNNEPAEFIAPPIAYEEMNKYRESLPDFDFRKSELSYMGKAIDNLRRRENVEFSDHPNCAFIAYGKYAKLICQKQNLDFALDDNSPLAKLVDLKAYCLLVGVDYDNMTSLHLSEYKSEARGIVKRGAKYHNQFVKYLDINIDSDDGFKEIGRSLEAKGLVKILDYNNHQLKLLRVDTAVYEGAKYFKNRIRKYCEV